MKRLICVAALLVALPASAAVRLTYLLDGKPTRVTWQPNAFPIAFSIDQSLAADAAGVTRGFQAWTEIPAASVSFTGQGVAVRPAGRDGVNSVGLSSDLFENNGFLAYTTTWFDTKTGVLSEADIQIDPDAMRTADVETLVKHEVGHLLGFDHSANLSSIMYPYVTSSMALDTDDKLSLAALYPNTRAALIGGNIRGQVRSGSGMILGAQVVALNDQGAPVATAMSNQDGNFELDGLPPGNYRLYAEPLDGPVDGRNFSGIYSKAATGFRTQFLDGGQKIAVTSGASIDDVVLQTDGLPASLNPRWIGVYKTATNEVSLTSKLIEAKAGETISIAIGGDGIIGGMTTFEIATDKVQRVSDFRYGSNFVWATFRIAGDALPSSQVVIVRSGNETATLTGALRIEGKTGRLRPVR